MKTPFQVSKARQADYKGYKDVNPITPPVSRPLSLETATWPPSFPLIVKESDNISHDVYGALHRLWALYVSTSSFESLQAGDSSIL